LHKLLVGTIAGAMMLTVSMGQTAQPARPATHNALAVVNISQVFGALNEKIQDDSDIDTMAKKINEEKQKRETELDNLQTQLKNNTLFNPDSKEYQAMQEQALQKSYELDSFLKASEARLMMEQRLKTVQIYRAMNTAIQKFAENNGIGMVLVADTVDFSHAQSTQDVQQRIALRKVAYFHPDFDITQKIIEKMNADFKLGAK
jgi:Skp family chaperone for outer membrane proteins